MEAIAQGKQCFVDWGVASTPLKGNKRSGDTHLVKCLPNGTLVAVVDGLGHGEDAADAAAETIAAIEEDPTDSVIGILRRCNDRLMGKRGSVMTIAYFDTRDKTLTGTGVGNVEGLLLRADPNMSPSHETLPIRRGVVGARLPALHAFIYPINPGDTLILVTDGIRFGFDHAMRRDRSPREIADAILSHYALGTDDALALVVRYEGRS